MQAHREEVATIAGRVKQFYDKKEKFRISHGSTNSTRPSAMNKQGNVVDTGSLTNVLEVNVEKRTALVEPNVPMDRLVEATLTYGLVGKVIMEFPGITVGGGYAGTSGESSSFKHGFFDRTLNSAEIVLANGDIVTCSETERSDLFHGAAGALGSLGVTTLVELQLQEAKKFVQATYHPVTSMSAALEMIKSAMADPQVDYIDGIMFSQSRGVVITGRATDHVAASVPLRRFSEPSDPWFYLHAQEQFQVSPHESVTEAIPLAEYLFRYDRGGFWVGAAAFDYFKMPFNMRTRKWLDDFLHTRMMYTALHASGQSKRYIVQDIAFPFTTANEFADYNEQELGIYPLWLCPLKQSPYSTMHPNHVENDGVTRPPMINIGLWGYARTGSKPAHVVKVNQEIERKVRELKGMKWLYAHSYYPEEEFWKIYDKKWYDDLREKYHATSLPSVFEKVYVDPSMATNYHSSSLASSLISSRPFGGLYGIKKAIESKTYLAARASTWKHKFEHEREGKAA